MSTIFFTDGVLASSISSATGVVLEYVVPPESYQALETLKARGARLGLIVLALDQPRGSLKKALVSSGLLGFFDPDLIIYGDGFTEQVLVDAVVKARKIPGRNYFVAEHCQERALALSVGFDRAIPHASLVSEVMDGGTLVYLRVSNLNGDKNKDRLKRFLTIPILPVYLTLEERGSAYIITTQNLTEFIQAWGFYVEIFPDEHDPQVTDLYLVQVDLESSQLLPDERSIAFLAQNNLARFILTTTNHGVVLALPPDVSIEQVHFLNPQQGHNRRLVANPLLLTTLSKQPSDELVRLNVDTLSAGLSVAEVEELKKMIIPARLEEFHTRYTGKTALDESGLFVSSRHFLHPHNEPVTRTLCDHLAEIGSGIIVGPTRLNFSFQGKRLSNIVAEIPGTQPDSCVIISAHFDSTAALDRDYLPERDSAPGADDDASGIAAVLAAVDAAVRLRAAGQLKRTLRFILFNAEEDRLYGSQVYVASQMPKNVAVVAVFQMDEIGHTGGFPQSEFEVHIAIRGKPETEARSMVLAQTIRSVVSQVSTVLRSPQIFTSTSTIFDPLEQHSDHTSFQVLGYAACAVTEDSHRGPLATSPAHRENRDHHHSTDREIDYSYAAEIARVVAAAAILTAKS